MLNAIYAVFLFGLFVNRLLCIVCASATKAVSGNGLLDTCRTQPAPGWQDGAMEQEQGKGKGKGRGKAKPKLSLVPDTQGNVVPMAKGQGKGAEGLTEKQRAFCRNVAEGMTLADSYRAAYDCQNMAPATITNEAYKLMLRQDITAIVNKYSQEKLAKTSHDAARIRLSVIERLQIEANDTTNPASVRVRALELLGKITDVALFTERLQTDTATTRSPDQITEELKERIAKLAG
jgi:hypothetical protein